MTVFSRCGVIFPMAVLAFGLHACAATFPLVTDQATPICISSEEAKCISLAVQDLQADITSITGKTPEIIVAKVNAKHAIMVGTIGVSAWVKGIEAKVPELRDIQGKSEAYVMTVVDNPTQGIDKALVVIGTDPRGTMWGIYTLCEEKLGVDPLKLWTEYKYKTQQTLTLEIAPKAGYPEIPYRGIFINDEWGLLHWNSDGVRLAHSTQAMIAETLLRLKANLYCVPMKGKPLTDKDNQLFHDRGILLTASHHEILLAKTQKSEWDEFCEQQYGKVLPYSYMTNKKEMQDFFVESINHHKRYNCIWPLGLRGAGDTPFWRRDPAAPRDMKERADIVTEGTRWQFDLLRDTAGEAYFKSVPKTITLYQELLDLYDTGRLKVPEGVMYIWPDDNRGTMRFPENKPEGQHGVYYHITYCDNHNVQYIAPEHIVHEFKKIMDFGADQYYLVNVGDVKENLLGTEYCMKLAWDGTRTKYETSADDFLSHWSRKHFPEKLNRAIAGLYTEYFRLAHASQTGRAQELYYTNIRSAKKTVNALTEGPMKYRDFLKAFRVQEADHLVQYNNWNRCYERAMRIFGRLETDEQRDFFRADILYNIQMHRLMLKWSVESLSAIKIHAIGDNQKAIKTLEDAKATLDELEGEVAFVEKQRYQGWYTERPLDKSPERWKPILSGPFEQIRRDLILLLSKLQEQK